MNFALMLLEVMDKEPGLLWWLAWSAVLGLAGFWLCRLFPRATFLVLPVYLFLGWVSTSEMRDPYVGPAIREEAGISYFVVAYLAALTCVAAPVAGYLVARRSRESRM